LLYAGTGKLVKNLNKIKMTKTYHMSVNIEGLLRNYKRKKINIFSDDNGNTISDKDARAEIARLQALGHKLMGCGKECEGFDPFGGGCPGHEIKDEK
jgi:hypothetical protein